MKTAVAISADSLLQRVVETSIGAVKPAVILESRIRVSGDVLNIYDQSVDLRHHHTLKCIAIGKCAEAMALEFRRKLGNKVTGIIATPVEKHLSVDGFEFIKTGHPYPDAESVRAGNMALDLAASCKHDDVIVFLISGGGSASVFTPAQGVTLEDMNRLIKTAMDAGFPVDKLNLFRRHLSGLGGGKLAAAARKARKVALIISDVVGDHLPSIASGPTIADKTSAADAYRFLVDSGLIEKVPASIADTLRSLSPHRALPVLGNNVVRVIASNSDALNAAERIGIENGFNTLVLTRFLESDTKDAGRLLVALARSVEKEGTPVTAPALLLMGGETTVRVKGEGKGGRNQHLVLNALRELLELREEGVTLDRATIFSFGTDGKDGNSDAAGAFASLKLSSLLGDIRNEVDKSLGQCDSNSFFQKHGGLITTGPTDTNVMDISGIIVE